MEMLAELQVSTIAQFFCKLAERSQDVFWIRSADFKTQLYINPAYETIWGRTCHSLYQDPSSWVAAVFPEDKKDVLARFAAPPKVGDTYRYEFRIVRPDQEIRWIEDIFFPLLDANHQCFGYAGIAKDVTHAKQHLAQLEEATRFFRLFAEKTRIVFWVRDPKCNRQIYVSPAYEKVWGKSSEALYKNPDSWIDTLLPEDRMSHTAQARIRQFDKEGSDIQYEDRYRIQHPNGNILWIKDTSFPIYDQKNKFIGFAGIAEDITKEKISTTDAFFALGGDSTTLFKLVTKINNSILLKNKIEPFHLNFEITIQKLEKLLIPYLFAKPEKIHPKVHGFTLEGSTPTESAIRQSFFSDCPSDESDDQEENRKFGFSTV